MKRYGLSREGFDKIEYLQDKYKFQDQIAIEDTESAIEFLRDFIEVSYLGLSIDQEDFDWAYEVYNKLGDPVEDEEL